MAGERGPDLNELVRPADQGYALVSPAGEVMEATGGRRGFGVSQIPDAMWVRFGSCSERMCDRA